MRSLTEPVVLGLGMRVALGLLMGAGVGAAAWRAARARATSSALPPGYSKPASLAIGRGRVDGQGFGLAAAAGIGSIIWLTPAASPAFLSAQVTLGLGLLYAAIFDLRAQRVPNGLNILLLAPSATVAVLDGRLASSCWAALLSFLILQAARDVFRRRRGRDGLGGGDVKLMAVLMLALGPLLWSWMLLAAVLGAAAWLFARRHGAHFRLPFAPFLATGAWLVLMVGGGV